ncbi:hypothetical protein JD844_000346 [Phrynosoma platyrhinos]|uniref:BtpA family membrane complex biogenesis protein n=1 Tax=Phrynosoma platyrhinos TaxID=52577 RepID=A0ABQ7SQM6_PHRPL|nr:hypothetical protein JD844_000346 [Phrynosoma platyrhinos]
MNFFRLFGRLKSVVIGMVHVKALPGTPGSTLPLAQIIEEACQDAEIYRAAGLEGLIVENMHDRPYAVSVGAEITAAMAVICASVKQTCPLLPLGVQILCAANQQAVAVALAAGLDFIRAEGFVFSHVADEGILNACAGDLLRYRKQIGAEHVQVFADIKKKHRCDKILAASSGGSMDVIVAICLFALLDAILEKMKRKVEHAVKIPVLVGSGVTRENVKDYLGANGLIVGSHFKKEGHWANSVDPDRVRRFMDHIGKLRE